MGPIGSLKENTPEEIWEGAKAQEVRKKFTACTKNADCSIATLKNNIGVWGLVFKLFKNIFQKKTKKYISCSWIEHGMDFDVGVYGSNLKLCCYLSHKGKGNAYIKKDYFGEKIDWKNFFKIRDKYRKNSATRKDYS